LKGQYKRIDDKVRDDDILRDLNIPLPNRNAKSASSFYSLAREMGKFVSNLDAPGEVPL